VLEASTEALLLGLLVAGSDLLALLEAVGVLLLVAAALLDELWEGDGSGLELCKSPAATQRAQQLGAHESPLPPMPQLCRERKAIGNPPKGTRWSACVSACCAAHTSEGETLALGVGAEVEDTDGDTLAEAALVPDTLPGAEAL
jgi:hypothetical protein